MTKYVYSESNTNQFHKHGIDLKAYGPVSGDISFVRASVDEGHFEEFKNSSWFIYYILEGGGAFILNDEKVIARQGDVIAIPPDTRIYYFGKMDFTLTVTPLWKEENETHIRDVDPSENPLV